MEMMMKAESLKCFCLDIGYINSLYRNKSHYCICFGPSNLDEISGHGDKLRSLIHVAVSLRGWSTAAGKKKGRKAGDSMWLHVAFDGVLCVQRHRSLNWHMLPQRCQVEQKIQKNKDATELKSCWHVLAKAQKAHDARLHLKQARGSA